MGKWKQAHLSYTQLWPVDMAKWTCSTCHKCTAFGYLSSNAMRVLSGDVKLVYWQLVSLSLKALHAPQYVEVVTVYQGMVEWWLRWWWGYRCLWGLGCEGECVGVHTYSRGIWYGTVNKVSWFYLNAVTTTIALLAQHSIPIALPGVQNLALFCNNFCAAFDWLLTIVGASWIEDCSSTSPIDLVLVVWLLSGGEWRELWDWVRVKSFKSLRDCDGFVGVLERDLCRFGDGVLEPVFGDLSLPLELEFCEPNCKAAFFFLMLGCGRIGGGRKSSWNVPLPSFIMLTDGCM